MKTTFTALAAAAALVTSTALMAQTTPAGAASGVGSPTIGTNLTAPQKKDAGVVKKDGTAMSDTTRSEVKSEAAATGEKKMGAGQVGAAGKPSTAAKPMDSDASRAAVQSEARMTTEEKPKIGTDLSQPQKKTQGVLPKASEPMAAKKEKKGGC